MLGVPDLDADTQHALFPNLPAADNTCRGSRWKWSDIGTAPALHRFVHHTQHPTAANAVPCTRHEQEAHDQGAFMALPNIAPTTTKQHASAKHRTAGDRKALNQGRSAPTSPRSSPMGVHTRNPACSPDPNHHLVSLRWGALGTPPLHHQLPTSQHSSACLSGSTSRGPSPPRFSTSSSHCRASPIVKLQTPTPNRGLPSEPHRSHKPDSSPSEGLIMIADGPIGDEARFRSASPSVARACVTLPGFCPPAQARQLAEEQHKHAAIPSAGKHALISVYEAPHNSTVLLYCCSAHLPSVCCWFPNVYAQRVYLCPTADSTKPQVSQWLAMW